jgi:hypothetical protein
VRGQGLSWRLIGSLRLPSRLWTVESSLACGVVVCRGGPLEVVGSGLRESRESGFHHHRTTTRSRPRVERRPSRPPSRADDELGWIEAVHALRRAVSSLSRLPDGGRDRADLCRARGLADVGLPSRHRSGPDRGRPRDRRGTHPGGAGPPRGERGPTGPSSPTRPFSRRSCTLWPRGERRRPSRRRCRLRSVPRLCRRADRTTR